MHGSLSSMDYVASHFHVGPLSFDSCCVLMDPSPS
jgi:hypothetical protein